MSGASKREAASSPGSDMPPLKAPRTALYPEASAHVPGQRRWPAYFPPRGTSDPDVLLPRYDFPCDHAPIEWWYFNTHLTAADGRKFAAYLSAFRKGCDGRVGGNVDGTFKKFEEAILGAVIDYSTERYYTDSLLNRKGPERLVQRMEALNEHRPLGPIEREVLALAKRGRLLRPDRIASEDATATTLAAFEKNPTTMLDLTFGSDAYVRHIPMTAEQRKKYPRAPARAYEIKQHNKRLDTEMNLRFIPKMAPVLHGIDGDVNGLFYYYIPRCEVSGTIRIGTEVIPVTGNGWYDREFGGSDDDESSDVRDGWTWIAIPLDNDCCISYFYVIGEDGKTVKDKSAVWTKPDGSRVVVDDVEVGCGDPWTSLTTFSEYPQEWTITVPSLALTLNATCMMRHQETLTCLVAQGGFYEGGIRAHGRCNGKAVSGDGFIERKNHEIPGIRETKGLLNFVSAFVRRKLESLYPLTASREWVAANVLGRHASKTPNISPQLICDGLFRPVRSLIDRGGKAWRSLILVTALNALSEHRHDADRYIPFAELLHVGSLIIDDIEDASDIRRGGKAVHVEYGVATAINAGTGCYFMAPKLCRIEELGPEKAFHLYNLYFDVLRSGHAGQGLDILGLHHLVPECVRTGDAQPLQDALCAIHLYKTGGAAGTICAMAALLNDSPAAQGTALENFGVHLGIAFQIVDDALNLRGFEGGLKEVGEDIRDGKITYPVIKALGRLPLEEREWLWSVLKEKTSDAAKITAAIAMMDRVGAIDDCLKEARKMVNEAWAGVDAQVEDSLAKCFMKTFCEYLTERQM